MREVLTHIINPMEMDGLNCVVRQFPLKLAVSTLTTVYFIRATSRMANFMGSELLAIAEESSMSESFEKAKGKAKAVCIITEKLK